MKKLISSLILCSMILSIFAPVTLSLPDFAIGQATEKQAQTPEKGFSLQMLVAHAETVEPGEIGCDISGWVGVIACGAQSFLFYIFVQGTQFFVGIAGMILDYFLVWSITSGTYSSQSNFIEEGWEIIRDMTNIIFLFALLIIAFNLVLGRAEANSQRLLVKTIGLALIINFSLFGVYAVIDASNVLARILYVKIDAPEVNQGVFDNNTTINGASADSSNIFSSEESSKSISLGLASRIQPQRILSIASSQGAGYGVVTTMILVVGAVNIVLIYVFLSVTLLFVGRSVALMILAILAPIAVASLAIPKLAKVKYMGWDNWFSDFLSTAFMAPIFILFLYLSVQFLSVGNPVPTVAGDILTNVLQVSFPLIAFTVMILTSKKVAERMAGEIASQVVSGIKTVATIAAVGGAGLAVGGAAIGGAALRGAGGVASKAGAKGLGRSLSRGGNRLSAAKINVSSIPGYDKLGINKTGVGKSFTKSMSKSANERSIDTRKSMNRVSDLVSGRAANTDARKTSQKKEKQELKRADEQRDTAKYQAEQEKNVELGKAEKKMRKEEKELNNSRSYNKAKTNAEEAGNNYEEARAGKTQAQEETKEAADRLAKAEASGSTRDIEAAKKEADTAKDKLVAAKNKETNAKLTNNKAQKEKIEFETNLEEAKKEVGKLTKEMASVGDEAAQAFNEKFASTLTGGLRGAMRGNDYKYRAARKVRKGEKAKSDQVNIKEFEDYLKEKKKTGKTPKARKEAADDTKAAA